MAFTRPAEDIIEQRTRHDTHTRGTYAVVACKMNEEKSGSFNTHICFSTGEIPDGYTTKDCEESVVRGAEENSNGLLKRGDLIPINSVFVPSTSERRLVVYVVWWQVHLPAEVHMWKQLSTMPPDTENPDAWAKAEETRAHAEFFVALAGTWHMALRAGYVWCD